MVLRAKDMQGDSRQKCIFGRCPIDWSAIWNSIQVTWSASSQVGR